MKAAVLIKEGAAREAFEIREMEVPSLGENEVLIKVSHFGLNYADVLARKGLYRSAPTVPSVLGYEVVGLIEEVGKNADPAWVGKRVLAFTRFGGYAEYAAVNEMGVVEIGDLDAGSATSLVTQYATAYYMAYECVNLFPGDRVLIHSGAGGVGTALIQLCKLKGAKVFANASAPDKLEYMKSQGADVVINHKETNYVDFIKKESPNERIDVAFNPVAGSTYKGDLNLVGAGGRVVLFGGSARSDGKWGGLSTLSFLWKMGFTLPIVYMMRSKSLIGVNMLQIGDHRPRVLQRVLKEVVDLSKDGKIKPFVGKEFPANEIGEAHSYLESRKSMGKIVVHW